MECNSGQVDRPILRLLVAYLQIWIIPMVEPMVDGGIIHSATFSILFLRYLEETTDPVWICHGKLSWGRLG